LSDRQAGEVIVGGGSAGGNLAAAMLLRVRDDGLPLPAAAVLLTPEADLTETGDSFRTNLGLDNVLTQSLMPTNLLWNAKPLRVVRRSSRARLTVGSWWPLRLSTPIASSERSSRGLASVAADETGGTSDQNRQVLLPTP
jgi:acetyl esterase/lipase